jgi:hypothetical protein
VRSPSLTGWTLASFVAHVAVAAAVARAGRVAAPEASTEETAPVLAGDTFEVNEEGDPGEESTATSTSIPTSTATATASAGANASAGGEEIPARPSARRARRRPARATTATAPGDDGAGGSPGLFGAAGDRTAVDLATAFTRGFPQAASADSIWATVPFGSAGEADVTLVLDESGKLAGQTISPGASPALSRGIARTLALIGGRAFTAHGPKTRLHVSATVSRDVVHDGLHGDVFAIGGSFVRAEGSAFFALNVGRRIDLRVTSR